AEVRGETRALLQRGLIALRQTRRLGLLALMETAGLDPAHLGEEHVGYMIAPRLNALGRLADANLAVEFLTLGILAGLRYTEGGIGFWEPSRTGSANVLDQILARARILAADLEALNGRRKLLCDQVYAAAEAQLRRDPALLESAVLVLAGPGWHPGVIGIVAGRLAERYGRPAVLFSLPTAASDEPARGSARSVPGINITAAIGRHAHLLLGFGGHPMAAGLSLPAGRIAEFRRALARTVEQMASRAAAAAGLQVDGYLGLDELSLDLVADLERLAPFGPGNPPLTLVSRGLLARGARPVGRDGSHLLVVVEDVWGAAQEVIWWDGAGEALPEGRFDLAYTVRPNNYRGERGIQVAWVAARPAEQAAAEIRVEIEVVDRRGAADPLAELKALLAEGEAVVWSEANGEGIAAGAPRHQLTIAPRLIIWTAPPGPAELREALRRVHPQTVYLFGRDPRLDRPEAFMQRLAGLVRYALNRRGGRARVSELAAALAGREEAVRLGLRWLAEAGKILCAAATEEGEPGAVGIAGDAILLSPGDGVRRPGLEQTAAHLADLLAETAAYRAYFAVAPARRLIAAAWNT
ncbi:MAG: single-stranded-DNA-specific exonuclease RecJ, partial [Anaerolineae bacterium]